VGYVHAGRDKFGRLGAPAPRVGAGRLGMHPDTVRAAQTYSRPLSKTGGCKGYDEGTWRVGVLQNKQPQTTTGSNDKQYVRNQQ
jgi:hypothetical protein